MLPNVGIEPPKVGSNDGLGVRNDDEESMADITMCPGTGCPLRETCLRYMAEPSIVWQSFADFTKYWHRDNERLEPECPHRIPFQSVDA